MATKKRRSASAKRPRLKAKRRNAPKRATRKRAASRRKKNPVRVGAFYMIGGGDDRHFKKASTAAKAARAIATKRGYEVDVWRFVDGEREHWGVEYPRGKDVVRWNLSKRTARPKRNPVRVAASMAGKSTGWMPAKAVRVVKGKGGQVRVDVKR